MRSRFLPVEQLYDDDFAPRTVQVAGALGDITAADVMAVSTSPPAEMGMWQYDFSDPKGPQVNPLGAPCAARLSDLYHAIKLHLRSLRGN